MLLSQCSWGVSWNAIYVAGSRLLTLAAPSSIVEEIKETAFPLLRDGLKLWGPAHVITYGVVPTQHRLLWVDCVEIVWVIILSSTAAAAAASSSSKGVDLDDGETKPRGAQP